MIVQKYGGSSLENVDKIKKVAKMIELRTKGYEKSVVVVSAMGNTTDRLLDLGVAVSEGPSRRELDVLLSSGEQVSASLLSMALENRGIRSRSLNALQLGIITDDCHTEARILDIDVERIRKELQRNDVLVVTGFQGVTENGDITTLGRGGSDTSAVALASALKVPCRIYSDVEGVFTCDPRLEPRAKKLEYITYDEMYELSRLGAKVLNPVAVETARKARVDVQCGSAFKDEKGTRLVPENTAAISGSAVTGLAVKRYDHYQNRSNSKQDRGLSLLSAVGYCLGEDRDLEKRFTGILQSCAVDVEDLARSAHSITALMRSCSIKAGVRAVAREFRLV